MLTRQESKKSRVGSGSELDGPNRPQDALQRSHAAKRIGEKCNRPVSNRRGYTLIKDEIASYVSKSGMDKESN